MVRKGVGIVLLLVLAVFFIGFTSAASCSITSSCADANRVMELSSGSNAHGAVYGQGSYSTYLCCDFTGSHTCTSSNVVLRLSSSTNAHAEIPSYSTYSSRACFGELTCYSPASGSCNSGDMQMVSLSSDTNAHIGSFGAYSTKICCNPNLDVQTYGNGIIEGTEQCDGSNFGSKTCATEKGAGWTGTLTCSSPGVIGTGNCVAPCSCPSDGNECTVDTCILGVCTHNAVADLTACAADTNECTGDLCFAGSCVHPAKTGEVCSSDGNPCTNDVCSSSGTCGTNKPAGTSCTADSDVCTNDICNAAGSCTHPAIVSCTNGDGCCPGSSCKGLDNDCTICTPATQADDCNDDKSCTNDLCISGVCSNPIKSGQCCANSDCNDYNACTTDLCSGTCSNPTINNCCTDASDCSGGDVCSHNQCVAPSGYCGDGNVDAGEECDDHNTNNNDGCDSGCSVESGWECYGEPSSCDVIGPGQECGNGIIEGSEECDDHNTNNNDGCSSSCYVEGGWSCYGEPSSCSPDVGCGDGTCNNGEDCESCPDDCGACDYCGNGYCDHGENCGTCGTDCLCAGNEVCQGNSCVALCGNGFINSGEDCDGLNLGGETCASVLGPEYTGDLGCSGCYFDRDGCYLACDLTSASWSATSALDGGQVRLNLNGVNCDGVTIAFTIMEKDGFLNPDDPVEKNPSNIVYASPTTYGVWTVEWQDDSEFGQSNPPEYYFTATAQGAGGDSITSSKTDADMLKVYQEDVVCSGVNYCSNYLTEAECGVDLCSVGVSSAPSSVSCGGTFNPETGCYDFTACGCAWNSNSNTCEANWQSESGCGVCGNHIKDTGEECDDGNLLDLDGCSSTCTYEGGIPSPCTEGLTLCSDNTCSLNCDSTDEGVAACDYDGKCDVNEGCTCKDCDSEQDTCKNGLICNIINSACCTSNGDGSCNPYCSYVDPDCSPAVCGNGFQEVGEECDLGERNNDSNSGCSSTCKYTILEPPCPEGTNLCNDDTCSLNCYATDDGIKGCGEAGACGVGLQCSVEDKACCRWSPDGFCNSHCAFVDPDCKSKLLNEGIFSIGTCLYTENSKDTCEDDGMLTRSLSALWNWSTENSFSSNPDGLDYWQPSGSGVFRYDPLDYSGLRKSQNCVYIEDTFACPASAQVSFFGTYQFVIVIVLVVIIYLIFALSKKKSTKHIKRHSRIKVKRRK